ncbi:MAG: helix-turn-helix domain-containing protein [Actinomycetota bacterium]
MATQEERRTRTRRAILDAARVRFTRDGWEATSIAEILDDAGVSRGALYHHFDSKDDVFAAVFTEVSSDAVARANAAVGQGQTPLASFIDGCRAWLSIVRRPDVAQVLLIDGPTALGWERCRALEQATSLHVTEAGVRAATRAGEISPPSLRAAALLVNALLAEAALASLAGAAEDRELTATIESMITGL